MSSGSSDAELGLAPVWLPSPRTRTWMAIGVAGVLIDCILGAIGITLYLRWGDPDGFDLMDSLDLVAIAPQALMLGALLALARQAGSIGLWRSSIGLWGCLWLASVLWVLDADGRPSAWQAILGAAVYAAIVALIALVVRRPWEMVQPIPEDELPPVEPTPVKPIALTYGRPPAKPSDWGWPVAVFAVFFILRKVATRTTSGWPVLVGMGFLLLIGGAVGFGIWSGIAKLRLRRELGAAAVAAGVADLAMVGLVPLVMVSAIVQVAIEASQNGGAEPPEPAWAIATIGVAAIILNLLIGAMFLTARRIRHATAASTH